MRGRGRFSLTFSPAGRWSQQIHGRDANWRRASNASGPRDCGALASGYLQHLAVIKKTTMKLPPPVFLSVSPYRGDHLGRYFTRHNPAARAKNYGGTLGLSASYSLLTFFTLLHLLLKQIRIKEEILSIKIVISFQRSSPK